MRRFLAPALLALTLASTAAGAPGRSQAPIAALKPMGGTTASQGSPFAFTATISSPESFTNEVEFQVVQRPSGKIVSFKRELAVVPGGVNTTLTATVNPAQWFAAVGDYEVSAMVEGVRIGGPLAFKVTKPVRTVPRFRDVTGPTGTTTSIGESNCGRFSSGAAWADVNGDGLLDLYVTRLNEQAKLFIHRAGHTFVDEAAARGVVGNGIQADGAVFADYDNDGDQDLLVVGDAFSSLYRNDGTGHFADVTTQAGLTSPGYMGVSGSFADYDSDGRLDLYITTHSHCVRTDFVLYKQEPDLLYHGNPDGSFTNVSGIIQPDHSTQPNLSPGAGFQAAWVDFNADNRQDLILANDYIGAAPDRNRLWQNAGQGADGGWHFTDISAQAGVNTAMNAMGIAVGDFNRDSRPDYAVSNLEGNKLFRNDGNMTFTDVAREVNVDEPFQKARRSSVTWGMEFGDFNLDAWPDLYVAAGYLIDVGLALGVADTPQHNQLFVNNGGSFLTMGAPSGADDPGQSRGVAMADYDRDGRLDLYVVNQGGGSHLFRNVTAFGPTKKKRSHWLEVKTVGIRSNRDGCGAILVAKVNGASLWREVFCGSTSVSSGSDKTVHFGTGAQRTIPSLTITWPSGTAQVLRNVKVDRVLTVQEPKV